MASANVFGSYLNVIQEVKVCWAWIWGSETCKAASGGKIAKIVTAHRLLLKASPPAVSTLTTLHLIGIFLHSHFIDKKQKKIKTKKK